MSTTNYVNMLKEIENKILTGSLKYKNTIIIGDNSSGKSEALRDILRNKKEGYYFIDSVNRGFDYKLVSKIDDLEKETYKSVIKTRIENDSKFNLVDSFDLFGDESCFIEQIYFNYEKEVEKLFEELVGYSFEIISKIQPITGRTERRININGKDTKLSNGFQAIIRILLELCYFKDSVEKNINRVVVIDEINEFLSSKNEEMILPFLMKSFNDMNFIITTHSAEIIATSIDCNIIALSGDKYQCLDGNDYKTVTDAREIFMKLYGTSDNEKDEDIEITLRNLLNIKISGNWTQTEDDKMQKIDQSQMSNAQKLLLNQIKSW